MDILETIDQIDYRLILALSLLLTVSAEIIAGNISDTMKDQIDKIKGKFGIENISFVFDRGMKSTVNLEYIKDSGYGYITAYARVNYAKNVMKISKYK